MHRTWLRLVNNNENRVNPVVVATNNNPLLLLFVHPRGLSPEPLLPTPSPLRSPSKPVLRVFPAPRSSKAKRSLHWSPLSPFRRSPNRESIPSPGIYRASSTVLILLF